MQLAETQDAKPQAADNWANEDPCRAKYQSQVVARRKLTEKLAWLQYKVYLTKSLTKSIC